MYNDGDNDTENDEIHKSEAEQGTGVDDNTNNRKDKWKLHQQQQDDYYDCLSHSSSRNNDNGNNNKRKKSVSSRSLTRKVWKASKNSFKSISQSIGIMTGVSSTTTTQNDDNNHTRDNNDSNRNSKNCKHEEEEETKSQKIFVTENSFCRAPQHI